MKRPTKPWRPEEVIWRMFDLEGEYEGIALRPETANSLEEGSPYTPWGRKESHIHTRKGAVVGIHAIGTERWVLTQLTMRAYSLPSMPDGLVWANLPEQEGFLSDSSGED